MGSPRWFAALAIVGVLAPSAASAGATTPVPVPPGPSGSVSLSSTVAGVRPVTVTVRLRYQMQCGYPGPGPLRLTFPKATRLPGRLAAGAVLLNGKRVGRVIRKGRRLAIPIPRPHGISCFVIAPGTVTVKLTRAANVENPRAPGTYALLVRSPKVALRLPLHITG